MMSWNLLIFHEDCFVCPREMQGSNYPFAEIFRRKENARRTNIFMPRGEMVGEIY